MNRRKLFSFLGIGVASAVAPAVFQTKDHVPSKRQQVTVSHNVEDMLKAEPLTWKEVLARMSEDDRIRWKRIDEEIRARDEMQRTILKRQTHLS
jgi:hypothetical protein